MGRAKKERRREKERQKQDNADARLEQLAIGFRLLFESWHYGILAAEKGENAGWNKEHTVKYKPLKAPDAKTAFWLRMQTAKILQQVDKAIVELVQASPRTTLSSEAIDARFMAAEGGAAHYMPLSNAYEKFVVVTYVLVAAFQDAALLMHDTHEETTKLRRMLLSFADKLLPSDSWMVAPMNVIYWESRDWMQCFPAKRGEAWYSPDLITSDVSPQIWRKTANMLAVHGVRKKNIDPKTHKITFEEPWFTPEWAQELPEGVRT